MNMSLFLLLQRIVSIYRPAERRNCVVKWAETITDVTENAILNIEHDWFKFPILARVRILSLVALFVFIKFHYATNF